MIDLGLSRRTRRVHATQQKRGLDEVVDRAVAADERRRAAIAGSTLCGRAEALGQADREGRAEEKASPARADRGARRPGQGGGGGADRGRGPVAPTLMAISNVVDPRHRWAARRTSASSRRSARSRRSTSSRATTSTSASCSARSTSTAAPRCRARGSTSSPASARCSRRRSRWRWTTPATDLSRSCAVAGPARAMEGTGFLGQAAENVYRIEAGPLPRRHVGGAARGVPHGGDPRRRLASAAVRRVSPVLPPGGGRARP